MYYLNIFEVFVTLSNTLVRFLRNSFEGFGVSPPWCVSNVLEENKIDFFG